MLMAGEVEEIVVYPGAKAALIFLRPDAIYKVKNMSASESKKKMKLSVSVHLKEVMHFVLSTT